MERKSADLQTRFETNETIGKDNELIKDVLHLQEVVDRANENGNITPMKSR